MNIDFSKTTLTLIELHTFYLTDGGIIRLNNSAREIVLDGNIYSPAVINRGDLERTVENEVTTLELTIAAKSLVYRGRNAVHMITDGLFDNVPYSLILYEPIQNKIDCLFQGYAASDVDMGSYVAKLKIKDILYRLEFFQLPRIVYQSQCNNTLYDFGCNLNSDAYKVTGLYESGDRQTIISVSFASKADNWFRFGVIAVTSGENLGQSRYVLSHIGSTIITDKPFWYDFSSGDTFNVWAGCDKLGTTCRDKFSNYENFAGFEFVPQQDAVLKL